MKLFKPHTNCLSRSSFFSIRLINDWNSLPQSVIDSNSPNQFKNLLDRHLLVIMTVEPLHQKKWCHAPQASYQLPSKQRSIHYSLLSAMFNPLHSIMNQELFKMQSNYSL